MCCVLAVNSGLQVNKLRNGSVVKWQLNVTDLGGLYPFAYKACRVRLLFEFLLATNAINCLCSTSCTVVYCLLFSINYFQNVRQYHILELKT